MEYFVYADLPRRLSEQERVDLFEALEAIVPDGGCVGPQASQQEEVYFAVDAPAEEEARQQAEQYMKDILQKARIDSKVILSLQQRSPG